MRGIVSSFSVRVYCPASEGLSPGRGGSARARTSATATSSAGTA